jgi:hypothetical protein
MRNLITFVFMLIAVATTGCEATRGDAGAQAGSTAPTLTGASVTFQNRDSGKDANSAVAIELLRNNAELAAESKLVGTKFDDNAPAGPMALSVGSPFRTADTDTARLRIRMTPDGKDEWTFDLQMALTFSDGSIERFSWPGLRLDNAAPERTLPLGPARVP